ncbi:hypothetical protein MVEG_07867 [Podila verticillata NRRL 6337]|nr:hypothetical protein MVEG_07867 [Podila verticillata NRRL 6337]
MSTPRLNLGQKQNEVSARSPIKPSQASPPISSSASGAIVDFFKQLNPTPHHTSNNTEEPSSRSPTSPAVPASDTIKQLRSNDSPPPRSQNKSEKHGSSSQQEEDSDDDNKRTSLKPHTGSLDQTKPKNKAPLSLEEAGRQFFNQLISK